MKLRAVDEHLDDRYWSSIARCFVTRTVWRRSTRLSIEENESTRRSRFVFLSRRLLVFPFDWLIVSIRIKESASVEIARRVVPPIRFDNVWKWSTVINIVEFSFLRSIDGFQYWIRHGRRCVPRGELLSSSKLPCGEHAATGNSTSSSVSGQIRLAATRYRLVILNHFPLIQAFPAETTRLPNYTPGCFRAHRRWHMILEMSLSTLPI